MSMLAALAKRWNYSVANPGAGRLVYHEGNREYTFPLFRENGELVLVDVPSSQRIYFFFNWYMHPHEFSPASRERIIPRIQQHLREAGARVRVFQRYADSDGDFDFYPELFKYRGRALELLDEAGYAWFGDFNSVDVEHGEYGLEVCGIKNERDARVIMGVLSRGFPHWHHRSVCLQQRGRDPGWRVALGMFPMRSGSADWHQGD